MIEILGGDGIENAFLALGVTAFKYYNNYQADIAVWGVGEEGLRKLQRFPDRLWKKEWGWWRIAHVSITIYDTKLISIRGNSILAWVRNSGDVREYDSLTEYFSCVCDCDDIDKVTSLAVDLAAINNMTLAKLFTYYQGDMPL